MANDCDSRPPTVVTHKPRVGILTKHRIPNFGSVLQAYATVAALRELGHAPGLVDYRYPVLGVHRVPTMRQRVGTVGNSMIKALVPDQPFARSASRFDRWYSDMYTIVGRSYTHPDDLAKDPPPVGRYLVGSDQVWNPRFLRQDESFLLAFASNEVPRTSYASSFGVTALPESRVKRYAELLARFETISVREETGQHIVRRLLGTNAELVLDPTMLFDAAQWRQLASDSGLPREGYVLLYGYSPGRSALEEAGVALANRTKLPVVRVQGRPLDALRWGRLRYAWDFGPREWLDAFSRASLVIAQSFHGTVFAILMGRPFVSLLRGDEDHDSRQLNLLRLLSIEDRAVYPDDLVANPQRATFDQDVTAYQHALQVLRRHSWDVLRRAAGLAGR